MGGPRLPGPAVHRVAGHRLPDLRDGVQLLRAAAGDTVPLLADIPGRSEKNPPETAGNSRPSHPVCYFMSTKHRAAASLKKKLPSTTDSSSCCCFLHSSIAIKILYSLDVVDYSFKKNLRELFSSTLATV